MEIPRCTVTMSGQEVSLANNIAVLGWGSLIWDRRADFDSQVGAWADGGPQLAVEFCRISKSRGDALTLVIDSRLGTPVETLYAISKRRDTIDTIEDLRVRESTKTENIGFIDLVSGTKRGRAKAIDIIRCWAETKGFESVVWTDLPAKFHEQVPSLFIDAALTYLRLLPKEGLSQAAEYVVNAPLQIATRLRIAIMNDQVLKAEIREYLQGSGRESS